MVSIFDIHSHINYYAYRSNGRYAYSSNTKISDPDLISVPNPSANHYQIWDGTIWVGSADDLKVRYGKFRVEMLSSSGWQRAKNMGGAARVPEFGTAIAFMDQNPGMVKHLWNVIIDALPDDRPPPIEVAEWRGIVTTTEIGIEWIGDRSLAFDFTDEGYMI